MEEGECMDFYGKTVLITGAGKGVGAETARQFAKKGAKVGLIARTEADILAVQAQIASEGGEALAIKCDVSSEQDVIIAVNRMEKEYGGVDILVNNAAVFRGGYVDELSLDDWHYPIQVILDGTFLCCKHVIPGMKRKGFGRIVNIASSAISHPFPTYSAYATAKAGLLGFGTTLTEEVREYGINVNTIILGLTNTAEVKQRASIPEDKMLQPRDVANVIMMLASEVGKGFKGAALELFGDYK
jgi:NAD(P)-dependent dehydrogenase (short-subunit alcohol dehydrogenase family)